MNFKKIAKKLFTTLPSSVLGIDIGTEYVKIVQVDLKGERPYVRDFAVSELPANLKTKGVLNAKDELISFLYELLKRHNFSTKHAVFSLNGKNVFVREIIMPMMPDAELKQAVGWDVGQYVPYEPDTFYFDYARFGEETSDGQQRIVLVAAPKEIVDGIIEISTALNLKVLKIDIDVLTICRTLVQPLSEFILLDIGHLYTMMTIFEKGAPVAQRALQNSWGTLITNVSEISGLEPRDLQALLQEKNYLTKAVTMDEEVIASVMKEEIITVARECRLTSDYYLSTKRDLSFSNLVIAGVGSKVPGLVEFLHNEIDAKVMLHDILQKVDFNPKFEENKVKGLAPILAIAVGAALAGGESDD
ncbi:MAG TPA: pilus assembly protein PilM [Candidatus Avacidaminococcus intestinavium]|uniref:Pilus assembly protein PilM n=1 Tax=Candidatus Avacidaminococcus intestinavium TaxID=2840684 RepID=A0A9D1MQ18_9FIRM|nr:pilus assembly protein PilM [Candidatus Avacidaminococcus intestinavium]